MAVEFSTEWAQGDLFVACVLIKTPFDERQRQKLQICTGHHQPRYHQQFFCQKGCPPCKPPLDLP